MAVESVIFDMDGVLVESEALWDKAREDLVKETGGRWGAGAQRAMMGMASNQWSVYVRDELEVPMTAEAISDEIVRRLIAQYKANFPAIPGAADVVKAAAAKWPLAVASSSNRELIDMVIEIGGLAPYFVTTVSSEEVGRGKPAPDVFLAAAEKLGTDPANCVVIEDSKNGMKAAVAAGMKIIAAPNREFPPSEEDLKMADAVVESVDQITNELIEQVGG
jgi:HAD superfamily hydrolase (TIGR01509 family)